MTTNWAHLPGGVGICSYNVYNTSQKKNMGEAKCYGGGGDKEMDFLTHKAPAVLMVVIFTVSVRTSVTKKPKHDSTPQQNKLYRYMGPGGSQN